MSRVSGEGRGGAEPAFEPGLPARASPPPTGHAVCPILFLKGLPEASLPGCEDLPQVRPVLTMGTWKEVYTAPQVHFRRMSFDKARMCSGLFGIGEPQTAFARRLPFFRAVAPLW